MEEVDGSEFRGRGAEDGGDYGVEEDFGITLLEG